jgi:hypothetical protein
MPEFCGIENVQTPNGEWVQVRNREIVSENDPPIPTREEEYIRFNADSPPPAPAGKIEGPSSATAVEKASGGAYATTSETPVSPQSSASENAAESQLSNAIAPAVPKPNVSKATLTTTNLSKTAPTSETKMDNELEYDEQYEEDDDRPWQVTKQTFKEIDNMSPSELEALIENIDANEEWRDLKHTAKVRTAQWIGAIKKADEAPRCQYLKTNGKSCGSPAMKGTTFCYFHGEARTKRQAEEASNLQEVPVLEDLLSLQLAITLSALS